MPGCVIALIGLIVYSFARIGAALGMAVEPSTRTTQPYDRWRNEVSLDEVERIMV
jgi:hypothetical protein